MGFSWFHLLVVFVSMTYVSEVMSGGFDNDVPAQIGDSVTLPCKAFEKISEFEKKYVKTVEWLYDITPSKHSLAKFTSGGAPAVTSGPNFGLKIENNALIIDRVRPEQFEKYICVVDGKKDKGSRIKLIKTENVCQTKLRSEIRSLVKEYFRISLRTLYTGIAVSDKTIERSGLAKKLREQSDNYWETAMKVVKKYIERGGSASEFLDTLDNLKVEKKSLVFVNPDKASEANYYYTLILHHLLLDSETIIEMLNRIHKMAVRTHDCGYFHDADWSHFAEEYLEDEIKRKRKIEGEITIYEGIKESSIALQIFDSHFE